MKKKLKEVRDGDTISVVYTNDDANTSNTVCESTTEQQLLLEGEPLLDNKEIVVL